MVNRDYISVAVVVRYTWYDLDDPRAKIDLKEAFPTVEEAEKEVERLNKVSAGKSPLVEYFVLFTRYFPEGRNVQVKY